MRVGPKIALYDSQPFEVVDEESLAVPMAGVSAIRHLAILCNTEDPLSHKDNGLVIVISPVVRSEVISVDDL